MSAPNTMPKQASNAVWAGWDVTVLQVDQYYPELRATRGGVEVLMRWEVTETGHRVIHSEINGVPTPYRQCARLIRSTTEGDPR